MPVFQEYSLKMFSFSDSFYTELIEEEYFPRCEEILGLLSEKEDSVLVESY